MERKGRQEHITKVIFDTLNNAREKCEYCEDGKEWYSEEVFKDFPNPRMDCHIDRDKRTGEYSLVVDNAVSCEINYCPMCGRRL